MTPARPRRPRDTRAASSPAPPPETAALPAPRVRWLLRVAAALVPVLFGLDFLQRSMAAHGELGFPLDDPYIHFQFARNLATGAGFSFNPGEPTPGATSPLWVLLLAAGRAVGIPIEPFAIALGLAAAAAAAVLTLEVAWACGLSTVFAFTAALVVGASGRFLWGALSGMEACLATALVLVVFRLLASTIGGARRALLLGAAVGIAAQARPELVLLAPLVAALEWRRAAGGTGERVRALGRFALALAVVAAPYVIFCLATAGRPLPNTFYAKSLLQLSSTQVNAARADYLPQMHYWIRSDNLLLGVLLLPGLAMWLARRTPVRWLVWLWPLAFWCYAMVLTPQHFSFSRYTIPLMPSVALLAMAPLEWLAARFRDRARAIVAGAAAAATVGATLLMQGGFRHDYVANVDNILKMQVAMGRWVAAHLPPTARVATNDVGAITYLGGRYCIDTVGLVTSDLITHDLEVRRSHPQATLEQALPSYFMRARPDYCILFPTWYPNLVREPWLRPIHEIRYPNNTGGGNELVVFQVSGPLRDPLRPR